MKYPDYTLDIDRLASEADRLGYGALVVDEQGAILLFSARAAEALGITRPVVNPPPGFDSIFSQYYVEENGDFFLKLQNISAMPGDVVPETSTFTAEMMKKNISMALSAVHSGRLGKNAISAAVVFLSAPGPDENPTTVAGNLANRLRFFMAESSRNQEIKGSSRAQGVLMAAVSAAALALLTFMEYAPGIDKSHGEEAAQLRTLRKESIAVIAKKDLSSIPQIPVVMGEMAMTPVVAPYSGVIKSTRAMVGQRVKKGDLLFSMDTRFLEDQLAYAQATALGGTKAAGQGSATAAKMRQQAVLLQRMISEKDVAASMDGYAVSARGGNHLLPGMFADEGEAVLLLAPLDELKYYALVPAGEVEKVKLGMKAFINPGAFDGEDLQAVVSEISVDAYYKDNVEYYGVVLKPDKITAKIASAFNANTKAKGYAVIYDKPGVVVAPSSAIHQAGGGLWAATVGPGGKRAKVSVRAGIEYEGDTEITYGLMPGEKIVID